MAVLSYAESRCFLVDPDNFLLYAYDHEDRAKPKMLPVEHPLVEQLVAMSQTHRDTLRSIGYPGADPKPAPVTDDWLTRFRHLLFRPRVAHRVAMVSHTPEGVHLTYEDGFVALIPEPNHPITSLISLVEYAPKDTTPDPHHRSLPPRPPTPPPLPGSDMTAPPRPEPPSDHNASLLTMLQEQRPDLLVGTLRAVVGPSGRPTLGTDFDGVPTPVHVAPHHYTSVIIALKQGRLLAAAFSLDPESGMLLLRETYEQGRWISRDIASALAPRPSPSSSPSPSQSPSPTTPTHNNTTSPTRATVSTVTYTHDDDEPVPLPSPADEPHPSEYTRG